MTDPNVGPSIYALIEELYPICRSITGNGVRQTLNIVERALGMPLHREEIPTDTPVLDWTVPREWNIKDAWVKNARGEKVIDFAKSNLHVVNYSVPVRGRFTLEELRPHLHSLPAQPDRIPYRTSYYEDAWGFCLTQQQLEALEPGVYDVCIDSTLEAGSLTYGELVLPGETAREILISTHVCHPSLCDDNLSGVAISVHLARAFAKLEKRRYTLRFLYAPGTFGAITWLEKNKSTAKNIAHGLTLTCLGDGHPFTYKKTVFGEAEIDRAAQQVLEASGLGHHVIDFFPYGYDERQYNSPGFRLDVGSLMRGRHGMFPEYHTSGDNLSFVSAEKLAESYGVLYGIIDLLERNLERNRRYRNLAPYGEPQLGKRGLYRALGGTSIPNSQMAMLWILNLSDGKHTLLDIADRAGLDFAAVASTAEVLAQNGLLTEVKD